MRHRIERDLEKAREEGEKIGLKEGKRSILIGQLEKKFGSVDDELKGLIESAPIEKIEEAALMIFDLNTIDQVKDILKG